MNNQDGFVRVTQLLTELYEAKKIKFTLDARSDVYTFDSAGTHSHKGISFWIEVEVFSEKETYSWGIWVGNKDDRARIPEIITFLERLNQQSSPNELRAAAIRARFTGTVDGE